MSQRKALIDKALFAERLRVELAKRDWSPTDLARHLKPPATRATTNAWANPKTSALPSGIYMLQLPALLSVESGYLFPKAPDSVPAPATDDSKVGWLDMKQAAARIAKGLENALRKSELVIGHGSAEGLERQRALVWALKDLARQLKRMGYSMDELFDLTDEMAAEIGLPPHPPHKDGQ